MAYNRHFIHKRKSLRINQINSSARISPPNEEQISFAFKVPGKNIIDDARKTGTLTLVNFGFDEIPADIYHINRPDKRRIGYEGFDSEDRNSWWEDVLLTKLDLSSNHIKTISEDIRFLSNLLYLDLQNNKLTKIPDEICELVQLRYLNLSNNQITDLPESIGTLNHLQQIILGNNLLKLLPTEFCRLLSLEVLDLSNNEFAHFPDSIGNFIKLKRLSISYNKLEKLPKSICKLKALIYFDVSQNKISEFPKDLDASFEVLKVNINMMTIFPIYRLTPSLKELHVDNNQITTLSSLHISFIPNINILTISKNNVIELPNEIIDLKYLVQLDVSFNNLQSIPYALGNMDTLQVLCVDGNPFRSINRTAITSGTEILKRYLRTRSNMEDITSYPNLNPLPINSIETEAANDVNIFHIDAHELNSTGTLDLSNRNITSIPENYFELFKFKKIKVVNLGHNKIVEFPLGILSCAFSIVTLDISFNRLLELPDVFNHFISLKTLNLNGNYLRTLPESFTAMKNTLNTLEVAHNPLGLELPEVIFNLVNLTYLNASYCAIVVINPKNFMRLKHLTELDLSNNEIEIIPPELGLCQHIKTANLDGNKIRHPALTSVSQGTEVVFEYLRSQIQSNL